MKVLLINGSPKEHRNTFQALSEVADTLNAEGIETEIVSIGKDAIHGCIACGYCGKTAYHKRRYDKLLITSSRTARACWDSASVRRGILHPRLHALRLPLYSTTFCPS